MVVGSELLRELLGIHGVQFNKCTNAKWTNFSVITVLLNKQVTDGYGGVIGLSLDAIIDLAIKERATLD